MDKKNCGDYEVTCSSCGRPWAVCKEKGGCSKCGDVRFCEYGRKASGCIREKQPGCPMQAVIPSVTVDTVNGIKGLSDCLVHVADINTTYYIDDQHRLLTTWGGPVPVYDYDFDENPLNLRNQMAYDTANNILAVYDKAGVAYKVPISNLDNDYDVMVNKPQINGHELIGNKTSTELGLQSELTAGANIQINGNTISATDTTYTAGNGIEIDDTEIKAKIGDGLGFDNNGNIKSTVGENKLTIFAPDYDNSGDLAVYKFNKGEDGKLLIVDFGQYSADTYTRLKAKLVAKGYTKFDYAIISHYHTDHVGMLPYMVADSTFDFSETQFYLPVTPDYSQFVGSTRYIPQMESDIKALLNNNNITYHIASDSTELTILDDFIIKFFNTDLTDFTTYYNITTTHPDTGDTPVTCYNNFSMVNLIEFDGKRVLLTGDIEEGAEAHLAPIIKVVPDVLKVEHHTRNATVDPTYLNTICKAKINFAMLNRTDVQPYVLSEEGQLYLTNYSGDINIVVNQYDEYATSENGALASDYMKFELDNVCNAIPAGADLNDYTYPCDMVVQSAAVAATIAHTPTTEHAYRLISIAKNYATRMIQFAIENTTDITYCRLYNQGVWSSWRIMQTGGTNLELTQITNLNDLATGCYYATAANSPKLTNLPTFLSAKRVKITVSNFGNDGSVTQVAEGRYISGGVAFPVYYWRVKHDGQAWSNWYRISNEIPLPLDTGTDLDNVQTIGVFCSPDSTTTATITNKPSDLPAYSFNLEVIRGSLANERVIQRITSISATMATYIRVRSSSGWSNWFKYDLTELV